MPISDKDSLIKSGGTGLSEAEVKDLIHNYGIWEIEDTFTSFVQQDAVEDVLTPIDFGDTKTSPNGLVFMMIQSRLLQCLKVVLF